MTDNDRLYDKVKTDSLLFDMEPGNASRTKFAVMIANDLSSLEVNLLTAEQQEEVRKIREKVYSFLV